MKREDIMPIRLYHLLEDLFEYWARWRPKVGYPTKSAGLSTGYVADFDDLAIQTDNQAMRIVEAAWMDLPPAGRIAIEMAMGFAQYEARVREGVLQDAVAALETRLMREGLL